MWSSLVSLTLVISSQVVQCGAKSKDSAAEKVLAALKQYNIPTEDGAVNFQDPHQVLVLGLSCSACHTARATLEEARKKLPSRKKIMKQLRKHCDEHASAGQVGQTVGLTDKQMHEICKGFVSAVLPDMYKKVKGGSGVSEFCLETRACPREVDAMVSSQVDAKTKNAAERTIDSVDNLQDDIDELIKKKGLKGQAAKDMKAKIAGKGAIKDLINARNRLEEGRGDAKQEDMTKLLEKTAEDLTKDNEKLKREQDQKAALHMAETGEKLQKSKKQLTEYMDNKYPDGQEDESDAAQRILKQMRALDKTMAKMNMGGEGPVDEGDADFMRDLGEKITEMKMKGEGTGDEEDAEL